MKVRALRGVCVGVERHLVAGDIVDLEAPLAEYLANIGAVEPAPDAPPPSIPTPKPVAPAKPGKEK